VRLLKVKLAGIKRFEDSDALLVADRLVAIVGPNEAGKTSLLKALDQIDRIDKPLPPTLGTRHSSVPPTISALFELEEDDRKALESIHGTEMLRRFWIIRALSGTTWKLEAPPSRDKKPRREVLESLYELARAPEIEEIWSESPSSLDRGLWESVVGLAGSETESFKQDERNKFGQLADALDLLASSLNGDEDSNPDSEGQDPIDAAPHLLFESIQSATAKLRYLVSHESELSPWHQAVALIRSRLPTILEFSEDQRDLSSEYDLAEVAAEPPPALANVAALAGLELEALLRAINAKDHGTVRLLRENANAHLASEFEKSYKQSDVCLQLDTDGTLLRLLVRSEGGEDFVPLSDRSAGFRWFVTLVAFLSKRRAFRPIVLIDEIETHLHYSAQADVVDVLQKQTLASQVVYTTHSAGALPPDLGRNLRAVVPVARRQRSKVSNSFWTAGPGFTPLSFASAPRPWHSRYQNT